MGTHLPSLALLRLFSSGTVVVPLLLWSLFEGVLYGPLRLVAAAVITPVSISCPSSAEGVLA